MSEAADVQDRGDLGVLAWLGRTEEVRRGRQGRGLAMEGGGGEATARCGEQDTLRAQRGLCPRPDRATGPWT